MHTEWSDGSGTVLSMAQAAVDRNYEYIAITDHGKQLKIAGGIDEEELREQGEEIKAANEQLTERRFLSNPSLDRVKFGSAGQRRYDA